MKSVDSFKIFLRDHKPKMNTYYPFLSQDQIMSKLRQQWKQLKTVQPSYSKPVVKTKARLLNKRISPTSNEYFKFGAREKDIFVNNDDNFEQDSLYLYDNPNFMNSNIEEYDSPRPSSPFMKNKNAIDSLNAVIYSDRGGPSSSSKLPGVGRTFAGRVFELRPHVEEHKNTSKIVGINKTGILRTPCKDRRNVQGRVSFSDLDQAVNVNDNFHFDEDFDEEVLHVENTKTSKGSLNSGSKVFDEMVLCKVKSQVLKNHSGTHRSGHRSMLEKNFAVKERQNLEENFAVKERQNLEENFAVKERQNLEENFAVKDREKLEKNFAVKDREKLEENFAVKEMEKLESKKRGLSSIREEVLTSLEVTPSRFSKRLKKLSSDISPRDAFSTLSMDRRQTQSPKTCVSTTPSKTSKQLKKLPPNISHRAAFSMSSMDIRQQAEFPKICVSTTPTRTSKRLQGRPHIEDVITEVRDQVLSSGNKSATRKRITQDNKLTSKQESVANNIKFTWSPESASQMSQDEADDRTSRCAQTFRKTQFGRDNILHFPRPSSTGPTKKHTDFAVKTYVRRNTAKKTSQKSSLDRQRHHDDKLLKGNVKCEVNHTEIDPMAEVDDTDKENGDEHGNQCEVDETVGTGRRYNTLTNRTRQSTIALHRNDDAEISKHESKLYTISTIKDLSLGTCTSSTLKGITGRGTLEGHHRPETVKDHSSAEKMKSRSNVEKMKDNSKAEKMKDNSNAEKMKDNSNAEKMKDNSNAEKMKDNSNAEKMKDNSNAEKMKSQSKVEKIKSQSSAKKVKSHSNAEMLKDYSNADILKDNSKAEKMKSHSKAEKMKSHHKAEEPKYDKLITRTDKSTFESKAAVRTDVSLVEPKFLSLVNTEVKCHKPTAGKSRSVRRNFQNGQKYDCKSEMLARNGRTSRENDVQHTASTVVLPEAKADKKSYKSPIDRNKGTIVKFTGRDCDKKTCTYGAAEDATDTYLEDRASNDSGSETDQDPVHGQNDFMSNMADQTSTTLLQAIERLKSLSSSQKSFTQECLLDNVHLSGKGIDDYGYVQAEKKSLSHMFQSVPQNVNRATVTPAKQRFLSSSIKETPSNFMDMFSDGDIFF